MTLAPTTTCLDLYLEACKKAIIAGMNNKPTPMSVVRVGLDNQPLPNEKPSIVMEGPCGFAWVTIRPARGAFVKFMKSIDKGRNGYYGGYEISTNVIERETGVNFGQSYERKMAAAEAFAETLQAWGINAVAEGRLD
jgi:hypothetical protein